MAQSKVSSLEGNELEEGYVRTYVPGKGRWSDTWSFFKDNFVQLVIINVITLLFFVPGIIVLYFRSAYTSAQLNLAPLYNNFISGYPKYPSSVGATEGIVLSSDMLFMSILIVAGIFASIGIAGASYSVKKMLNTRLKWSVRDYFRGIKVNFFSIAIPVTIFMTFIFASYCISDWGDLAIATGASKGGPITAKVFIIIATVIVGIMCMWFMAVGISYKVKLRYLIKNSFVLFFGTIIQSIFMLGFTFIPVWLLLIGKSVSLFKVLGYVMFIFIGFSFMVLSWVSYTQWVFDMFITPAVKKEDEARKATLTPKQLAAEKEEEERAKALEILAAGRSELIGRPIRPIDDSAQIGDVGVAYGRADIARVASERSEIRNGLDEYYNAHKGDAQYAEYEKMFAEREKALVSENKKKKDKKKKIGRDTLLGNN